MTCDRHGEFNILTFSVNERRLNAWIGLHRNISTKIKSASTYRQKGLTSGPPQVIALSRSGAQRSAASARTNGPQYQLDHARSPNVGWPGCPRFLHKTRKTQSPRGPDPRWPSLFERILAFEEGEGAHSEPLAVVWVYTTGNCTKFYDLEEFPYDFPETLHASLYWLVMKKCRRQLFPNITWYGDRREKHPLETPKNRDFWGKSAISSERLPLAATVRTHFCRTALRTLDRRSLIGLALTAIEHLAFPQDPIFDFCAFFDILGDFSPRSSRFSAPFVEHKIVARVFVRA